MWNASRMSFGKSDENGATDDEEALQLAAVLQRSPTDVQARTSIFRNIQGKVSLVDVGKLGDQEQKIVLDKLIATVTDDQEMFFKRIRNRFDV